VNRRTLGYAAAVAAVFALIVAGALVLGDDDEDPREVASETSAEPAGGATAPAETATEADEPDSGPEAGRTETDGTPPPEPAPEPDSAAPPAPEPARYVPYSASGGDWQADVPEGNGWGQATESQRGGGGTRVTVRGPDGATLLIDHTPNGAARFGSKYRSRRDLSQPWFGSMTEYRLGENSVGYVLNASASGPGWRVFATGVEGAVARRVAGSLSYVDL
jgi:hypothetical protein